MSTSTRYTLDQARALLRWLQERFQSIVLLRSELKQLNHELEQSGFEANDPDFSVAVPDASKETIRLRAHFRLLLDTLHDTIGEVSAKGCSIRQIELGEIDIPGYHAGQPVVFCWRNGAKDLIGWKTGAVDTESHISPGDALGVDTSGGPLLPLSSLGDLEA